jgi:hypothetical protein
MYEFKPASFFEDLKKKLGTNDIIAGYYDSKTGKILMNIEAPGVKDSMVHEGLHLLTNNGLVDDGAGQLLRKVGLEIQHVDPKTLDAFKVVNRPLNEGITEMITRDLATGIGFSPTSLAYPRDLQVARKLAEKFGPDVIADAYFKSDIEGLTRIIDQQLGEGAFKTINELMDQKHFSRVMSIILAGMK